MFHTENVRLLSESAVFALWTYASLVVGGFQGGSGKAKLLVGAACALCINNPMEMMLATRRRLPPEVLLGPQKCWHPPVPKPGAVPLSLTPNPDTMFVKGAVYLCGCWYFARDRQSSWSRFVVQC